MTFAEFARAHGLIIRDLCVTDRIHRCATIDHPRSQNGAYYYDGRKGWIQRWDQGDEIIWWEHDKPWTQADKEEWDVKRLLRTQQQKDIYDKAAERAQALLDRSPIGESPYLSYKGVKDVLAHVNDGETIVPLRDFWTDKLTSVQIIKWNLETKSYEKKFLPGGKTSGSVYRIGRGKDLWFCEGFATGKSLKEALDLMRLSATVVCTFSAHNLVKVAKKGYVFADNDASGVGQNAAASTGLPWLMSPEEGQDANDYHVEEGLLRLCRLIQNFLMSHPVVETADLEQETTTLKPALKKNDSSLCPADGFVRSGNIKISGTTPTS